MFQHVLTVFQQGRRLSEGLGAAQALAWRSKRLSLTPTACNSDLILSRNFYQWELQLSVVFSRVYWDPLRSPEHWATPNYYVWTYRLLHVASSSLHLIATSRDVSGLYMDVSYLFSFYSFSQVFVSLCLTLSPSKSSTSPWSNPPGWLWSQPGQSHERQVTASHSNLRSLKKSWDNKLRQSLSSQNAPKFGFDISDFSESVQKSSIAIGFANMWLKCHSVLRLV